jgi:hypothetical protein
VDFPSSIDEETVQRLLKLAQDAALEEEKIGPSAWIEFEKALKDAFKLKIFGWISPYRAAIMRENKEGDLTRTMLSTYVSPVKTGKSTVPLYEIRGPK